MTPEEVKQLIKEAQDQQQIDLEETLTNLFEPVATQLSRDVQSYMSNLETRLETRLDAIEKGPEKDEQQEAETQEVESLRAKLAETEKKLQDTSFDSHLASALSGYSVLPQVHGDLRELLTARMRAKASMSEDGTWTIDGVSLSDSVKTYLSTDSGKHYLAPTSTPGAGTTEPGKAGSGVSTAEALLQAFL